MRTVSSGDQAAYAQILCIIQVSRDPNAFVTREGHAGSRQVQSPESGSVVAVPQVGGLHHSARSVIFGTRGVSAIGTNVEPREGQGTALRDPFEESSPRRF